MEVQKSFANYFDTIHGCRLSRRSQAGNRRHWHDTRTVWRHRAFPFLCQKVSIEHAYKVHKRYTRWTGS